MGCTCACVSLCEWACAHACVSVGIYETEHAVHERTCASVLLCVYLSGHVGGYECICMCTGVQVCLSACDNVV